MRLAVTLLGLDLFSVEVTTEAAEELEGGELAGGTLATMPIGFSISPGDQRWEAGAGGGEL